jgi:crotonobetainyl-CoA:carnitine CoA-transferase CaiB-like acyl-CoA transferase
MEALAGIKILDFSQMMFGPWATQMLADVGAEVIKVEPPAGEWQRRLKIEGNLLGDTSPFFVAMNRNKKFIALDLKLEESRQAMYRLVAECDVVVNNFRPDVMRRLGLDYDTLKQIRSDIIYCQATGYGTSGPYVSRPGQDLLIQSMSGLVANTGRKGDPPTPVGSPVADAFGSLTLAQAVLVSLLARERHGIGQYLEVDLLSATIAALTQEATAHLNMPELGWERSEAGIGRTWLDAPFGVYAVADGFVAIAMSSVRVLGEVLSSPELADMESLDQFAERDRIARALQAALKDRKRAEVIAELLERDVWVAPVYSMEETFEDPQVRHLGLVEEISEGPSQGLRLVRNPVRYERTPALIKNAAKSVGADTYEVLSSVGYTRDQVEAMGAPLT